MFLRQALAMLALSLPVALAHAEEAGNDSVVPVHGQCAKDSHTATGPIGSDLQRTSFACNVAILSFSEDRVLIQFTTGTDGGKPVLGLAGPVVKGEDDVVIDTIYFEPKQAVQAGRGSQCELTFKEDNVSKIYCGASVDDTQGQRHAMVVSFTAAH